MMLLIAMAIAVAYVASLASSLDVFDLEFWWELAALITKMVQNLVWAAGYNIVALPLAAGALAWAGILLPPAVGAVLMSASTIVVVLNAQLLRRLDLSLGEPANQARSSGRARYPSVESAGPA